MKRSASLLFFLLASVSLTATATESTSPPSAKNMPANSLQAIPLEIAGKTLNVRPNFTRAYVQALLASSLQDAPSVDTAERIQYDAQLAPEQAPVTLVFDFDNKGLLERIMLDAYAREQNPPAVSLLAWIKSQGIRPIKKTRKQTVWRIGGWKIEHTAGGSGEDAAYRIDMTRTR